MKTREQPILSDMALAWVSLVLVCTPASAQKKIELPAAMPGIGAAAESLQSDLDKLNAYHQSVEEKMAPTRKNARDPFQTTPELRSRSGRAGFAPSTIGGGGNDFGEQPVWRVRALALGRIPYAVVVRSAAVTGGGKTSDAEAMRQRFVRSGDRFEMPDGRLFRVMKIDREGVWMKSEGVEEEEMRIQ